MGTRRRPRFKCPRSTRGQWCAVNRSEERWKAGMTGCFSLSSISEGSQWSTSHKSATLHSLFSQKMFSSGTFFSRLFLHLQNLFSILSFQIFINTYLDVQLGQNQYLKYYGFSYIVLQMLHICLQILHLIFLTLHNFCSSCMSPSSAKKYTINV